MEPSPDAAPTVEEEEQRHNFMLAVHVAAIKKTEEEQPMDTLIQQRDVHNRPRPCGRPQQISRESRCLDRNLWAHFAVWDRQERLRTGPPIAPACGLCETMTFWKCRSCHVTAFCEECSNEALPCLTCLEIRRLGLDRIVGDTGPSSPGGASSASS